MGCAPVVKRAGSSCSLGCLVTRGGLGSTQKQRRLPPPGSVMHFLCQPLLTMTLKKSKFSACPLEMPHLVRGWAVSQGRVRGTGAQGWEWPCLRGHSWVQSWSVDFQSPANIHIQLCE